MVCAVCAGSLLVIGLGLLATRAEAQMPQPGVALSATGSFHSIARSGFRTNDQLNRADCEDDDVMSFPVVLTNPGTNALELWAGIGCQAAANRTAAGLTQCWKLFAEPASAQTMVVQARVRDILVGYTRSATSVVASPDAGTALASAEIVSGTGREACDASLPVVSGYQLYFMLTDASEAAVGTIATYSGHFKLLGPPPPEVLDVTAASNRLAIRFSYFGNQSTDPSINGYLFFCDPAAGGSVDGGVDAGADASCAASAPSKVLLPGAMADSTYQCGIASRSEVGGSATGLANGALYHVAIAAVDTYQNVGPLSNVACALPQPNNETATACSFSALRRDRPAQGLLPISGLTLALWQISRRRARASGAARRAPRQ